MTSETLADIVAEMRGMGNYQLYSGDHARQLADRIEAASRRDAAIHAMTCEANERLREHLEIALENDKRTVGNAAAMREALKLCGSQMCRLCKDLTLARSMINKGLMGVSCHPDKCKPYQAAQAALSAPRRNCDVGTPEEQQERFREFCRRHEAAGECGIGRTRAKCPCWCGPKNPDCALAWAQMPYEEGGAK